MQINELTLQNPFYYYQIINFMTTAKYTSELASKSSPSSTSSNTNIITIAIGSIVGVAFIALIICLYHIVRWQQKKSLSHKRLAETSKSLNDLAVGAGSNNNININLNRNKSTNRGPPVSQQSKDINLHGGGGGEGGAIRSGGGLSHGKNGQDEVVPISIAQSIALQAVQKSNQLNQVHKQGSPGEDHSSSTPADFSAEITTTIQLQQLTSSSNNSGSGGGTTTFNNTTTVVRADPALSIPAFLEAKENVDFKLREAVNKGAASLIMSADIISENMIVRAGSNIAIAKLIKDSHEEDIYQAFIQEISLLWIFKDHPNVVKIVGFSSEKPAAILMKMYRMGSVFDWLHIIPSHKLPQVYRRGKYNLVRILLGLSRALLKLHELGCVHCDIKPGNILLEKDEQKKMRSVLTDFGVVQIVETKILLVRAFKRATLEGVSVFYASPEAIEQMNSNVPTNIQPIVYKSRDVYSIGMVIAELLSRRVVNVLFLPINRRR